MKATTTNILMEEYAEPCDLTKLDQDTTLIDFGVKGFVEEPSDLKFIGETPEAIKGIDQFDFDMHYLMNNDPSVEFYDENYETFEDRLPNDYQPNFEEGKDNIIQIFIPKEDDCLTEKTCSESKNVTASPKKVLEEEVAPEKPKRKVGRKPLNLGLSKRKDVVFKSVLRKIRNFFWTDINKQTKYQNKKGRKDDSYYFDWVTEYITKVLEITATNNLVFLLGSMANPRDMIQFIKTDPYNTFPKSKVNKWKNVHGALYLFNQKRYEKEILKSTDMKKLILAYFNRPEYEPKDNDEIIVGKLIINDCSK